MTTVEGPVVRTATGAVCGRREGGLTVFRGIPFAEPPVGEARFAAPRPVRAWEGTREAYAFGPPPPQESAFMGRTGVLDVPKGSPFTSASRFWSGETRPPGAGLNG